MDIISSFVIVAVAALLHASFQLSVSMLTLLSSHTIGKKRSHKRLVALTNSFVLGVGIMTTLLLSLIAYVLTLLGGKNPTSILWITSCGILVGVGIIVWFFYYRKQAGTSLWIPRSFARFLADRAKKTKYPAEAFSLGITSVAAETLFIAAPLIISALVLIELNPYFQLAGLLFYGLVSSSSLLFINTLITNGLSLSRVQKWRESNKHFLQFAAGSGLLVLGFYVYVDRVVAVSVYATAGGA
jgi:hypothetical protein